MNIFARFFGKRDQQRENAPAEEHTASAKGVGREEQTALATPGHAICAKCGSSCVTDAAPFSSAVSIIRCPNGHYTRVICVACKKGIMTRVSDMDFTVSAICNRCGHASTGIPLKWWEQNVRHTPEDLDELSRIHDPSRRALFQFLTSKDRAGSPPKEPATEESFRKTAAEHLDYLLTTYVGTDLQRSGAPCAGDPETKVRVKSVRGLLDPTGHTVVTLEYESPAGQQIDAEVAKRALSRRLMEFYAVPLTAAPPEHSVGVVRWRLGELLIGPGQII